jgi:hypothetical protein
MKMVEVISKVAIPETSKQLQSFLGIVNYYNNMWPNRLHFLAPLSAFATSKAKWDWTQLRLGILLLKETS